MTSEAMDVAEVPDVVKEALSDTFLRFFAVDEVEVDGRGDGRNGRNGRSGRSGRIREKEIKHRKILRNNRKFEN